MKDKNLKQIEKSITTTKLYGDWRTASDRSAPRLVKAKKIKRMRFKKIPTKKYIICGSVSLLGGLVLTSWLATLTGLSRFTNSHLAEATFVIIGTTLTATLLLRSFKWYDEFGGRNGRR